MNVIYFGPCPQFMQATGHCKRTRVKGSKERTDTRAVRRTIRAVGRWGSVTPGGPFDPIDTSNRIRFGSSGK